MKMQIFESHSHVIEQKNEPNFDSGIHPSIHQTSAVLTHEITFSCRIIVNCISPGPARIDELIQKSPSHAIAECEHSLLSEG
jgi:hypothetical protein